MKQAWVLAVTKPCVPTENMAQAASRTKGGLPPPRDTASSMAALAASWMAMPHSRMSSALLPFFSRQAVMRLNVPMVMMLQPKIQA